MNDCQTKREKVQFGVYTGPYFPILGLNAEIYKVNLCIQPEFWMILEKTRENPEFEYFSHN